MASIPLKMCLGTGVLFTVATYWFHAGDKKKLAAVTLLLSLTAFVFPFLYLAGPPAGSASTAQPAPTHFQVELLNQVLMEQRFSQLVATDMARGPKRLSRHEATVYSQFGEDGIIAEMFRRIGTTNRYFVEFGSGDGSENNTVLLLLGGWSGLWMDASEDHAKAAMKKFEPHIREKRLRVHRAFVNAENIEDLLRSAGAPASFDLLSIDIDRNDYWVWKAIQAYSPRAVVIEYNAVFPPGVSWVVNYEASAWWDGTSHFGASLTALEALATEKGYSLVGCNLLGSNAFFVRNDLTGNKFAAPFTAENHYQPPRYHMLWYKGGHPRQVGAPGRLEFLNRSP